MEQEKEDGVLMTYHPDQFLPHVEKEFRVTPMGSEEHRILRLCQVKVFDQAGDYISFSLLFDAPINTFQGQGLVRLEAEEFETMENLFLVAVTPKDQATGLYEIAFSVRNEREDNE